MLQKVYKVVRVEGGVRKSGWECIPNAWRVIYEKGRWAVPQKRNSYLFACKSLRGARSQRLNWLSWGIDLELWEAKADVVKRDGEPSVINAPRGATAFLHSSELTVSRFEKFWQLLKKAPGNSWWLDDPFHRSRVGTLYCRKIKLVKKIS